AKSNPQNEGVNYSISDFYEFESDEKYDFILVFDAYPHFIDKEMFCRKAQRLLKEGGGLWIFFDENKDKINSYHSDSDEDISVGLKSAAKEVKVFKLAFDVAELVDDEENYRIGLVKKKKQAKGLKKNREN
ncbi:MAG: class I SAM-dependent methyltransferase, partial [Clostridia bacterium]|nr:class I SAM-dependent methyltransferase [Clostridia bacterium]